MAKHILTALVKNRPGVLARVSNLFRRRSFNIDSLSVGRTQRENLSRITIVMESHAGEADRLVKNLYKLVNVVHVDNLQEPSSLRGLSSRVDKRRSFLYRVGTLDGGERHEVRGTRQVIPRGHYAA